MKRIISLLLVFVFCFTTVALASGTKTMLQNEPDRNIVGKNKLSNGKYSDNPVIDGQSPVTGMPWDGFYQPMLVQIDNTDGGTGPRAPWGADIADVTYETPLYKNGTTRVSFLFSDSMPEHAGPVRSARVGHCWMREEWDAGFIFFGTQELKGSSCAAVFKETGADKKGVLFSGIVGAGHPWMKFIGFAPGIKAPSNVDVNVKAIAELVPKNHVAIPHPFLFADELPIMGEAANVISIDVGHKDYNSRFEYNQSENAYYRFVNNVQYTTMELGTRAHTPVSFKNLIIQRTKVGWNNGNGVAPLTEHIGKGNCDIFIGGKYIPGYWERPDYTSRTVYMDQAGNELQFQRGKTFILVTQYETPVSFN